MKSEDIQSECQWMVPNYGVNKKNACSVVSTPTHLNTCRKEKCGFWAWQAKFGERKEMKLSDLSESERTLVETELSERLRDLVYMKSREYGKRVLSKYGDTDFKGDDKLRVSFTFEFIWNDILQIIGRARREGKP